VFRLRKGSQCKLWLAMALGLLLQLISQQKVNGWGKHSALAKRAFSKKTRQRQNL
jgi:hypothetical protein